MHTDPIVIVEAKRTVIGTFQGALKDFKAPDLGALAIKGCLENLKELEESVDEVIMGCVLTAGLGQAPSRQSVIKAGLRNNIPATTVNKVCGSGMRSIILAHDLIKAGSAKCIIAGGMESMTNAPYLSDKARAGLRMGHAKLTDHMFFDGLEDAYESGTLMGHYAEKTATKYGLSRQMQDTFALKSYERAKQAMDNGHFANQMTPVLVDKEGKLIDKDEPILNAKPEKIPQLKPAFAPDGTVTAANASGISDGAAALVLMPLSLANKLGLRPRAKIVGHAQYSHEPQWFTTAPIGAIRSLTQKVGWEISDVDLWEINEAFAVVTLAAIQELKLDPLKVNIHGGACALGHPIGATGARLVVSLLNALELNGLKRGIASPCIGGGEATAIAIEVMD